MRPKDPPKPKTAADPESDEPPPGSRKVDVSFAQALANAPNDDFDLIFDDDEDEAPPTKPNPSVSAFDRATIAPPVPEREYVERMMMQVPDSVPAPGGGESLLSADEVLASTMPTPVHGLAPLTLDFSETLAPPAPGPAPVPSPADPAALAFAPVAGDALGLAGVRAGSIKPGPIPLATLREIRDRFDVGDFSGALSVAETILEQHPDDSDAAVYAQHCREKLKQMYIARLGGLRRTPHVSSTPEQLRWLALDHRAGFLLSLVDGRSTLDEVLDMSGMGELEALRLLMQLMQQNVLKVV